MERTRAAGFRILPGLLIAISLLSLVACATVKEDVPRPEKPSLNMSRLPLHAALVVPDFVQATISDHVVTCTLHFFSWTLKFPVGKWASSAAEEMLSQAFVSVNRVNDKAAARGIYDVVVDLTSFSVQMENDCSVNYALYILLPFGPYLPFGGPRDLNVRLLLSGKITDQSGQTPLGEASFEAKRLLAAGIFNTYKEEIVGPALENALLEASAELVNRLGTKPKLVEYARAFKAPQDAPSSRDPVIPSPVITAPTIY